MARRRWFRTTRQQRKELREMGNASTVGYMLVASIGIGGFFGYLADRVFHSDPWGMMVGLLLGIGAGFFNLFELALRLSRDDEEERRRKRDDR